jgi:hypothetical protein
MLDRSWISRTATGSLALMAVLTLSTGGGFAFDEAKYPNLKGQWDRIGPPRYDQANRDYEKAAPLTPEALAVYRDNLKDMAAGGQGTDPTYTCLSPGMPRSMNVYEPMEIVVTPNTTHILIDHIHDSRRIFTDGRPFPADALPTLQGYSIGQWIDTDGDGKYDVLEVETRNFKGPRAYDASGLRLSDDNNSIVKEKMYLDKADPNILVNELTVIDSNLTKPWSVVHKMKRIATVEEKPVWREVICAENNNHVEIGKENYFLSADGFLMPARKDQPPPDLKYFKKTN